MLPSSGPYHELSKVPAFLRGSLPAFSTPSHFQTAAMNLERVTVFQIIRLKFSCAVPSLRWAVAMHSESTPKCFEKFLLALLTCLQFSKGHCFLLARYNLVHVRFCLSIPSLLKPLGTWWLSVCKDFCSWRVFLSLTSLPLLLMHSCSAFSEGPSG